MNKILEKMLDLVFDKYCQLKETSYQSFTLVCTDPDELRKEVKAVIDLYLDEKDKVDFNTPRIRTLGGNVLNE